jgi:hypothetical protein
MAEPILHKSPPKESNKTTSCLDSNHYQSPDIEQSIPALDEIPPIIAEATVCYLPGPADYFVGILEETVSNLTRLHEDLNKVQKMLVKGGAL